MKVSPHASCFAFRSYFICLLCFLIVSPVAPVFLVFPVLLCFYFIYFLFFIFLFCCLDFVFSISLFNVDISFLFSPACLCMSCVWIPFNLDSTNRAIPTQQKKKNLWWRSSRSSATLLSVCSQPSKAL